MDFGVSHIVRLNFTKAAKIENVLPVLLLWIVVPAGSQKLVVFEIIHHPAGVVRERIHESVGDQMVRSGLHAVAPTSARVQAGRHHFLDVSKDIEHGWMVRRPRAIAQRHDGATGLRPTVRADEVLAILLGLGHNRRRLGMFDGLQSQPYHFHPVTILRVVVETVGIAGPIAVHAGRHQSILGYARAAGLGLCPLVGDPFAGFDQPRRNRLQPFAIVAACIVLGEHPQVHARPAERVTGGEEPSIVVSFGKEVIEPPPGKVGVPAHVHAANHRRRFQVDRTIGHRCNPRQNIATAILVAGSQEAVNLRSANRIGQQRIGDVDLHGLGELVFPVSLEAPGPPVRAAQDGVFGPIHRPGRQIDDQPGRLARRELTRQVYGAGLRPKVQRGRPAAIEIGQQSIADSSDHAVLDLPNAVWSVFSAVLRRELQLQGNLGFRVPGIVDRVFRHADRPVTIPAGAVLGRFLVKRRHVSALLIDGAVFRNRGDRLWQPSAVKVQAQLALASSEGRREQTVRFLGIPFHLGAIVAVGSVVGLEMNRAAAIHDVFAIVAGQSDKHRAVILDRVVRLGHCPGKRLVGLRPNLLERGLFAGDCL